MLDAARAYRESIAPLDLSYRQCAGPLQQGSARLVSGSLTPRLEGDAKRLVLPAFAATRNAQVETVGVEG